MSKRQKTLLIVVFAVLSGILLFRVYDRSQGRRYADFRAYHAAAQRLAHHEPLYIAHGETIGSFKYFPVFAMALMPLAPLSEAHAYIIFSLLNLAALGAIFFMLGGLAQLLRPSSGHAWGIVCAMTVVFCGKFFLQTVDTGQVILIIIALVLAGITCLHRKKPVLGAAFFAFSIMIKYMPVIFLPYFILKRQIKFVVWVFIWMIFYAWLPSLWLGQTQNNEYLKQSVPSIIRTSLDQGSFTDYKNQSVYSLVTRTLMKDYPYRATSLNVPALPFGKALDAGIVSAFLLYPLLVGMIVRRPGAEPYDYAVLFVLVMLLNPNAWPFNCSVFVAGATLLLHEAVVTGWKRVDRRLVGGLVLALILTNASSELIFGKRYHNIFDTMSFLTLAGLALIALLLHAKRRYLRTVART